MNQLSFNITHEESPAAQHSIALNVSVLVDDCKLPYILDVDEFFSSFQKNGRLPLFTCACGMFGCGGFFVNVESTSESWTLKNRYNPLDEDMLVQEMCYAFLWKHVIQGARFLIEYIEALKQKYPGAEISSGVLGRDIASRVEHYRKYIAGFLNLRPLP